MYLVILFRRANGISREFGMSSVSVALFRLDIRMHLTYASRTGMIIILKSLRLRQPRIRTAKQPFRISAALSTISRSPEAIPSPLMLSPLARAINVLAGSLIIRSFKSSGLSIKFSAGDGNPACTVPAANGSSTFVERSGVNISNVLSFIVKEERLTLFAAWDLVLRTYDPVRSR